MPPAPCSPPHTHTYRPTHPQVIMLSRLVAVRTLQLELVYVYRSLEEEALDIGAGELARKGGWE